MTGAKAIREAFAAQLRARFPELQVSAVMLADPTPEAAHVWPARVEYDRAFARGLDIETYIVEVFVSDVIDEASQDVLDDFLEPKGPTSVKEALEVDRTLGGLVAAVQVKEQSGYRRYLRTGADMPVLGASWTVQVWKD